MGKRWDGPAPPDDRWHRFPANGEWRQITLRQAHDEGHTIYVGCQQCGRSDEIEPKLFAEQRGISLDTPFIIVGWMLKCIVCNERSCYCRMNPYRKGMAGVGGPGGSHRTSKNTP